MIKQMSGNPTSITMIAAWCSNPILDLGSNELIYLYDRIKEGKEIVVDELCRSSSSHQVGGRKNKNSFQNNIISLDSSTRMSIELLQQSSEDDLEILYFLGCLPGGVKETQLKCML